MSEIVPRTVPGTISEVALDLPGGLSADDWKVTGEWLGRAGRAVQWWIGDWLNYGDKVYGKTYTDAAEITGYPEKTLRSFAYVARNVELSRRRDDLSWSHHVEVAAMVGADQERWLTAAAANGWSKGKLRSQVKSMTSMATVKEVKAGEIVAGIDKIDPATKPVAEVRKAWEQKRVRAVGLDLPSRSETERQRVRKAVAAGEMDGPKVEGLLEMVSALAADAEPTPDAFKGMSRDELKRWPREIERARENLLDIARDIERLLAEGES